jgi:hypothetical protein
MENAMNESAPTSLPNPESRAWPFWVSLALWLFAAWQLYLFSPMLSTAKVFGIEPPQWTQLVAIIPTWLPLLVGMPLTLLAAAWSHRTLRRGVVVAALLFALATYRGHVALQIKTHQLAHHPAVAVRGEVGRPPFHR